MPPADTVRYTIVVSGFTAGERLTWREDGSTWGWGGTGALGDHQHNVHLVAPDVIEEAMRRWMAELPGSNLGDE